MLNNVKNAAGMMKNAQKIKAQQDKLQKLLASIRVSGQSKNGKVTATITGDQKIVSIDIDPTLITFVYENFISVGKDDAMMSKAIIEAVDNAIEKVQGEVVKKMQENDAMGDLMSMLQAASGGQ